MGSLFGSKSAPTPPPEQEPYNVIDNVTGTKQTIVTAPDGTKSVVIDQNLTPEQQEISDNLKQIAQQSLDKYTALVNDPTLDSMPEVKDAVNTIYNQQVANINQNYKGAADATEKVAARYGVNDSTAATQARAANTNNLAGALSDANAGKVNLTNQYRQQEMTNQLQAYGLASGRQDTLLAQGLQTLSLGNQTALNAAAQSNAYNQNLYNQQVAMANANSAAQGQLLGALGTAAGFALGGPLGAAAGSRLFGSGGGFAATGANPGSLTGFNTKLNIM